MPTETFTADADFTIPDFVFSLTVALEGEAGEEGVSSVVQGRGGTVVGEISVTPGQTYHIRSSPGGDGNQGGGDSIDIRFGGTALTDRIAVAAGGGAGGDDADFGGIGTAGGDGGPEEGEDGEASDPGEAGLGGTQTAGGEGGTASFGDTDDGQAGSFGAGGDSGFRGGAGGAGWYGGGGAAGDDSTGDASGGGGGSNYAEGLDSVNANQRGTSPRDFGEGGLVTIEYDPLEPSLDVTNPTDTTTDLSWSITLPDNVDSVEEWQLYRDTDTGSDAADYTPIATYPPGTTSDTDTGLDQGTTYHYRVGAAVTVDGISDSVVYNFETGNTSEWADVNGLSAVTNRVYNGSYAGYCGTTITDSYQARDVPDKYDGGAQPPEFTFYWNENSGISSRGGGIRLVNSNGEYEVGLASDNPSWLIDDNNGFESVYSGDGYDRWVRFTITFDWSAGEFDADFEDLDSGATFTDSGRPLKQGQDIEAIQLESQNEQEWRKSNSSIQMWFDDITLNA